MVVVMCCPSPGQSSDTSDMPALVEHIDGVPFTRVFRLDPDCTTPKWNRQAAEVAESVRLPESETTSPKMPRMPKSKKQGETKKEKREKRDLKIIDDEISDMLDTIDKEYLDKTGDEIQKEHDANMEFHKREGPTSDELVKQGAYMLDDELEAENRDHLLNFGDNAQETQGRKKISGAMYSVAADHVGNSKLLPEIPILPSPGSIRGAGLHQCYRR